MPGSCEHPVCLLDRAGMLTAPPPGVPSRSGSSSPSVLDHPVTLCVMMLSKLCCLADAVPMRRGGSFVGACASG